MFDKLYHMLLLEALCGLEGLQRLSISMCSSQAAVDGPLPGLACLPAVISRLTALTLLALSGHPGLAQLPPALFFLPR